ncbi:MAG: bifunctional aspartate kinase/homoserine dehydrogenase I [Gemmatimonadaceae bacterium]
MADGAAVRHAAHIVRAQRAEPTIVVVSAMAGVTDALSALASRAASGETRTLDATSELLRARHADAARNVTSGARQRELLAVIDAAFTELAGVLRGLAALRELTPRTNDLVLARGERLSARCLAAALEAVGVAARYVDGMDLIRCDATFGSATPDLAASDAVARRVLAPLLARRIVPVVPGFFGAAPSGDLATLGRGGSDLTATLLGRALGARQVSLWKDVAGLLTADPRLVPDARVIPQLNAREAAELAYYGAKVLHPRALIPLAGRSLPIVIRPFADPAARGTEISARDTGRRHPVRALSAVSGQALITVTGNGMLGVPGIAARTFAALQHAGVSVSLISQASSEHSICIGVPETSAEASRQALEAAFRDEIARRLIDGIDARSGTATIAVVGLGMAGSPGVAAKVFAALAHERINVVAIAQGSSELNISVVVDAADMPAAVRRIHTAFQLNKIGGGAIATPERVDVALLGFGQIGRTLCGLITAGRWPSARLVVVAVIDRSGVVFDARGLSPRRLSALAKAKARGEPLATATGGEAATALDAVRHVARHALSHPILVDATADDTTAVLQHAMSAGMNVVLANKRPLSGPKREADGLRALAQAQGKRILHETTVGAGLPIIDTFHKLVESGDRVLRIDGCTSGTLGYLMTEVGRGRPFSDALRRAMAKGYTEPDPREDLAGTDVARKALILGRLLGFPGELSSVAVESLVPEPLRAIPLADFLRRLGEMDDVWAARLAAARTGGGVLRYVASVTRRSISVGLRAVDASSPFASLKGTDNQVVFRTRRYDTNPLVITGPGAGPPVTAAGVLNDVLKLAGAS